MKNVLRILSEWDPIELLSMAPDDEYEGEAKKICEYLKNNSDVNEIDLAEKIHDIFLASFGNTVYHDNVDVCMSVARRILECKCLEG